MNLTEWYEGSQKPIHIGVYERDMESCGCAEDLSMKYSYWNGAHWMLSGDTVLEAAGEEYHWLPEVSVYQNLRWRGITLPA